MTHSSNLDRFLSHVTDVGLAPLEDLADRLSGAAAAPLDVQDQWVELGYPDAAPEQHTVLKEAGRVYMAGLPNTLTPGPSPKARLDALRDQMREAGITVLLIPRTDEYQGEYLPKRAERVLWLTGFSGSAGAVIVTLDEAAIFVDGRYTLQVRDEVDTESFTPQHLIETPPTAWIKQHCSAQDRIGFDPWLHTQNDAGRIVQATQQVGATLVRLDANPIDAIWEDQPAAPLAPVRPHEISFAGESTTDKRDRLAGVLKAADAYAVVLTATDSIAWLLNVRGGDVPNCPLPLSFAVLKSDSTVDWFIDARKLTQDIHPALGNGVSVHSPEAFGAALEALGVAGKTVQADPATAPAAIFDRLRKGGAEIKEAADPCLLPKACKNAVEQAGTRKAHQRDGVAVTRFLKWLEEEGPKGQLDELKAIDHLRVLRRSGNHFRGLSFDTIAGAGPNGAIIHYRASAETNRRIETGQLLLVDSGGQYLDGTTDVTRTVAIGPPTEDMRTHYTLVLKGHIATATARFPKGVSGSQLDTLARAPLWQAGLDFDHGTGHGVGSYLNVHEGPQRISKGPSSVALRPGMILSNEPGYYKPGAYGIRIENLVLVRDVSTPPEGAERDLLEFETITLAPYDRSLINTTLLTPQEKAWVDSYHMRVLTEIGPDLSEEDRTWLEAATAPLS